MRIKNLIIPLFCLVTIHVQAQDNWLTKKQITEDVEFLTKTLNEKSSYAYLNGFDFNKDFDYFLLNLIFPSSGACFPYDLQGRVRSRGGNHSRARIND